MLYVRAASVVGLLLLLTAAASAQELPERSPLQNYRLDPAWMEADAASTPSPFATSVISRFSLFPNIGVFESGGIVGLTPRLSLSLVGGGDGVVDASGMAGGLRLSLLPPELQTTRAVLAGGYSQDLVTGPGLWGRLSVAQDVGRLRLVADGQVDGGPAKPSPDVTATTGASVRTVGPVRVGLEYFTSTRPNPFLRGRQFLLPTVGAEVQRDFSISGGVPIGLSARSSAPRVSATYLF
jgi:hypothetical protein